MTEKEPIFEKQPLNELVDSLDKYFGVKELDKDPAMSRFIPMVYDPLGYDWKSVFEPDFCERFNGLMLKGAEQTGKAWCIVFPSNEVLTKILKSAQEGDMIFSHHPVNMECGDPRGAMGKGFLPIDLELLQEMRTRKLSFYAVHAPLDSNTEVSTNDALVRLMDGEVIKQFDPYGLGFAGRVCRIPRTTTSVLAEKLRIAVGLPYVDLAGIKERDIELVGVIAGGGGSAEDLKTAEEQGVDAVVTGEVSAKIIGSRGDKERAMLVEYLPTTKVSAIGLSHAGSEFVVMRDQVVPFLKDRHHLDATSVPENNWWR
ncbi:hypothetical protein GYA37_03255 [candidate division WWE3 bacterium]|uniref:GTP cyclohydrolase 1 type 2 homolog n=1 Tax=candidate division WWE3 bacterium TaxID=2053526 RepID=A0A7X9HSX5_UNCKA|nr:hypothetical protein [candidate division WWE3 bacterium]